MAVQLPIHLPTLTILRSLITYSNQSELTGDHAQDEVVLQCQNFSGVYDVIEHKKKSMKFESTTTLGFSGKKVVITIEKE